MVKKHSDGFIQRSPRLQTAINFAKLGLPLVDDFLQLREPERIDLLTGVLNKAQKEGLLVGLKLYKILSMMTKDESDTKRKLDADKISASSVVFSTLDIPSRKKMVKYNLTKKIRRQYEESIVDKERIPWKKYLSQELSAFYRRMESLSAYRDILEGLTDNAKGLDPIVLEYLNLYFNDDMDDSSTIFSIQKKIVDNMTEEEELVLKEILISFGCTETFINKLFEIKSDSFSPNILSSRKSSLPFNTLTDIKSFLEIVESHKSGMFSYNLNFMDFGIESGITLLGETKMRELYANVFSRMVRNFSQDFEGISPLFEDILGYKLSEIDSINQKCKITSNYGTLEDDKKRQADARIFQHKLVWELDDDFSENVDLKIIAGLIKEIETDFNVNMTPNYRLLDKRFSTLKDGNYEFIGCFVTNSGFEGTHILIIRDKKTGKKYLNLGLGGASQDEYIYLHTQINYYLKYKKFINKSQLYVNIYYNYNKIMINGKKIFSMETFGEQYAKLIKDIVYPLSLEYYNKHKEIGKIQNTLLVGLYGTGKSQFLLNLLLKKKYLYKGKELNLNANVISMSVIEFMNMLQGNGSVFQKQLMEINNNTNMPILLIIEDLDTMIDETNNGESKSGQFNLLAQALTTFLDGVGSLPINIITTTNFPEKLSYRLIRPGRIENVISFNLPLSNEIVESIIQEHIKLNGLSEEIFEQIKKNYIDKMTYFTPSHIASFLYQIRGKIDMEREFNEDYTISEEEVEDIFNNLIIPIENIVNTQKGISSWEASIKSKKSKTKIGFEK